MKVIFLDIDGVLNHELFYTEKSQDKRYAEVGLPFCDLDGEKVKLLNSLIKDTGAKVVISSTWRKGETWQALQIILEKVGFKGEIIDSTPILSVKGSKSFRSIPRGVEIQHWIDDNAFNGRYIIFDDDSDMLLWQRENYFQVDGYCGLTPNLIYRAERYLNKQ